MRRVGPARRVITWLTTAALVCVACGTTTSAEQQQAAEASPGDDLGLADGVLPEGAHINKKGQVISKSGEVLGTAEEFGIDPQTGAPTGGGGGTTGTTANTGGGTSNVPAGALGPGITDDKIYMGMVYTDAGAANQAAFGTPLDADARKPYNAMVEAVNEAGGILGREVEILYYQLSATQPIDPQVQAASAHWTQDNEIFVFLAGDASGILQECAKKVGGVMPLTGGASLPEEFVKYPNFYEISGLNFVRTGNVTIAGLHNQNYFGTEPRIGVVLWDEPNYKEALERGYLPALEELGLGLATEPAYITSPQQAQDLAASGADVNSAVLRFQTQNITHVMILDGPSGACSGACLGTLFLRRSEQQSYRPRYGFNAYNLVKAAIEAGLYPKEQLPRSVAVEWADDDKSYDEGWHLNKARERCYDLMRKKGVPMGNVNEQGLARFACEQFWFIQDTVAKMGGATLNAPNFTAGVNVLGWSYQSPSAYEVHFSPKQHDGVSAARNMKYVNSCECYQWTSKPYRV